MAPFRPLLFCGVTSLLSTPAVAQFGVGGKKRSTNFQDLNEMAKEEFDNNGMASLDNLGNLNMNDMNDILKHAMEDPEMKEMMQHLDYDLEGAMQELANLSPEDLAKQMEDAMSLFTSEDYLETAMANQDEILKNLESSGMMSAEDLAEFKANPQQLEQEMKAAMDQLKDLFADPEAMNAATEIAQGLTGLLTDPSKLAEAMAEMTSQLSDDDAVEEARLQILANPELLGNSGMEELFAGEDMMKILKDPVAWKKAITEGKDMLFADGAKAEL